MTHITPIRVTRWQRWRIVFYGFVGIVLVLLMGWGYLKYREYRDWALFDEMLAEQDRKHPQWRWQEFQPKPLQPGEVNKALRFIDVGRLLTTDILNEREIPDEERVNFPMKTREWLTTLNRESERELDRIVRDRCKHIEKEVIGLLEFQQGCPPINDVRPTAEAIFVGRDGTHSYIRDEVAFNLVNFWLYRLFRYHLNEGHGDEAAKYWQALLAAAHVAPPGNMIGSKRREYYRAFLFLYQMMARTEPSEKALFRIQQTLPLWRSEYYTLDDVYMDRAWAAEMMIEMKEMSKGSSLTGLHQMYAKPAKWLPEKWHDLASSLGIGSPSLGSMYRMELQTHLRMMDFLEERLKAGKPVYLNVSDLLDDPVAMPGKHFSIYFAPRWKKILADLSTTNDDLLCMEALIAAERYRLKHGDYPKQWSDLVPSLLKEIPKTGDKAFNLKPVPEGLVIYVPGEKDYGGKVLRKYNPESNETDREIDQGLMIFYPKYRRQPPPPVKPKAKSEEP